MLCFVHLLRKTQFSISNCSTETFALFSQRVSAILSAWNVMKKINNKTRWTTSSPPPHHACLWWTIVLARGVIRLRAYTISVLWLQSPRWSKVETSLLTAVLYALYCVSKNAPTSKRYNLKIIMIKFDDIWQKYPKASEIEFACFSFHAGLLFYQLFVLQTGHQK